MSDETPVRITYDASNNDSIFVSADQITPHVIRLDPPPIFGIRAANGQPTVTVHHDGRLEYGPDYQPDEAARLFWEAVEQQARNIQYGAPLNTRINEHLKAGEEAERKVQRLDQMAQAWAERLPETLNRDTVVDAIHQVTRGET